MDYKGLGDRIRTARLKLKMTQQQLADTIDMSANYLGKIERADRILSLETLVKIANALGTNIDYLLSDSVNVNSESMIAEIDSYMVRMNKKEQAHILNIVKSFYDYIDESTERINC